MNYKKMLKSVHLAGTVWFMLCMGYVFILAMWQAGFNWVLIFSLSGHLALFLTLMVSLYLYAIFRNLDKGPNLAKEHPLTSTGYYLAFYMSAPFLGILPGAAAMIGETEIALLSTGIALGTLGVTFITWVIVDPVVSMLEMLVPESRQHRLRRLAADRRRREKQRLEREESLRQLFTQQEQDQHGWEKTLAAEVTKLAELLRVKAADFERAEREAVNIGIRAWRTGGIVCMRHLRDTAVKMYKEKYRNFTVTDYISTWWDGIGNWRTSTIG